MRPDYCPVPRVLRRRRGHPWGARHRVCPRERKLGSRSGLSQRWERPDLLPSWVRNGPAGVATRVVSVVIFAEGFRQHAGRVADNLRVQPSGLPGEPLDRTGDGYGGDNPPGWSAHRRGDGGDPRLTFAEALAPAPPSYSRQNGGREARGLQALQ